MKYNTAFLLGSKFKNFMFLFQVIVYKYNFSQKNYLRIKTSLAHTKEID